MPPPATRRGGGHRRDGIAIIGAAVRGRQTAAHSSDPTGRRSVVSRRHELDPEGAPETVPAHLHRACPVCRRAGAGFFAEKDGYRFSRCGDCGFVFLDPMPSGDDLADQYTRDDGAVTQTWYPKARSRMRRSMVKAIRFSPYLWRKDVIDIGCGGGFMVEAMRRCGARAVGVDISRQAIAYARHNYPKNRFFDEDLADFARHGLMFDFIYASEVMEHLPGVDGFMSLLSRIARPGARVYITTPDIAHRRVPATVTEWDLFCPPHHVQFFSETAIRALFARYGFRVRHKYFKIKPGLQILAQRR